MLTQDLVHVVPYDASWPSLFAQQAADVRAVLGAIALRIDHIGSTAIPGLAAKPIVDVQISVADFDPLDAYRTPLKRLGYGFRADNPDLTKRYFREALGQRRTHIHVRRAGRFNEQFALLFRDFMRAHPETAADYASLKRQLAQQYPMDRQGYTEAKGPFIWRAMMVASDWSQRTAWLPSPSDA